MKKSIILIIIFSFVNCKTIQRDTEKKVEGKVVREYYKTGELKATGPIEEEYNKYSNYRKGFWKEFYKNGNLKEKGNFKLDTYTSCCTSGLCEIYYSYKFGEWSYFYENGKLKANGIYNIERKHKETSCEEGTEIEYGNIDNSWFFYNEKGNEIKPNEKIISEIKNRNILDIWDMSK